MNRSLKTTNILGTSVLTASVLATVLAFAAHAEAGFVEASVSTDTAYDAAPVADGDSAVRTGTRKRIDDEVPAVAEGDTEIEIVIDTDAAITVEAEDEFIPPPVAVVAGPEPDHGIDFGDDRSMWSNDGFCDDPRFVGAGMAVTTLMPIDAYHDASDCRAAFEDGLISMAAQEPLIQWNIHFGDNSSLWSYDGECDDPRFEGPGMVHATPVAEDLYRDAADCSDLYLDGLVELAPLDGIVVGEAPAVVPEPFVPDVVEDEESYMVSAFFDDIDFGDDASQWSNDGECDDPRFAGPGMTATILLEEDIAHDATDCLDAYMAGLLWLAENDVTDVAVITNDGGTTSAGINIGQPTTTTTQGNRTSASRGGSDSEIVVSGIDFGDDSSQWAYDYECDDPRFAGPGMTATVLLDQDMYRDATDCHRAWIAGDIWLR